MPAVNPNMPPNEPLDELSFATSEASSAPNGSEKPESAPSVMARALQGWASIW